MTGAAHHVVRGEDFDVLASGAGDLAALQAGRRSRRLVVIGEVLARLEARAPDLALRARLDDALAVLVAVQRESPSVADQVLLDPHVGAWASECLRQLVGGGSVKEEDVGHFGAVAVAAAWQGGRPADLTCFLRHGHLFLPGMGRAWVGPRHGWCRVRCRPHLGGLEISTGGRAVEVVVTKDAEASPSWTPMRSVPTVGDGPVMRIDDLDPYRGGGGGLRPAPRLGAGELARWQAAFDEAWRLLEREHPGTATAISAGMVAVVPLATADDRSHLSASRREAIGAMAMTAPPDALTVALALVHEFQHTKLSALLDLVPLLEPDGERSSYAPWRGDPRPLHGLLQGTYAYLGVTAFWEIHRRRCSARDGVGDAAAQFEFALWCRHVAVAAEALHRSKRLTDAGRRFVAGLRRRIEELAREPVPAQPLRLARLACRDNMVAWRLRNLVPSPDRIAAGTEAWLSGRPCPRRQAVPAAVVDGGGPLPSDTRLRLMRHDLGASSTSARTPAPDASEGDVLLLSGRTGQAAAAYRRQIERDPDDLASWAGLALAHRSMAEPGTSALPARPEDVYALHRSIRRRSGALADPDELAGWLATAAL